jgi:polyphenol oxidase
MGRGRGSGACPEPPSEGAAGQRGGSPGKSQQSLTTSSATIAEAPVQGAIPRFEIPGWREEYGVVAGITGRGSEMERGFDLGLWSKEPVGEVMSRWLAFRRAMTDFHAMVLGNQVHGVEVMQVQEEQGWIYRDGIDGWITTMRGILLAITVADCIPVYLVAPARGVALLHAGWRGTAGGILGRGVERLTAATNSSPANLVMHCGIGICGRCYEVGAEVVAGCGVTANGPGPWHLDLREILAQQARARGLTQITTSKHCSAHDRHHFYSHRASGGTDGRMVAYLGMI